jgi:lipopolysaccharide export system protein LptA
METGDVIESFSQQARYDQQAGTGELFGSPKAVWKQPDSSQLPATLTADKIFLNIKDSELSAYGHVVVVQSSYTLKAEQIAFLNQQKKVEAAGQRPEFTVNDQQQNTVISAEKIYAWTEKKQINFIGKVRGVVMLKSDK